VGTFLRHSVIYSFAGSNP